jgi:hypothetical protein
MRSGHITPNVPLPELALDVNVRKVPEGFKLEYLPEEGEVNDVDMSCNESPKKTQPPSSPKNTISALLKGKK